MAASEPDPFVIFIDDELSKSSDAESSQITPFFRVPAHQRQCNPKAYDPSAFAFGPYHAKLDLHSKEEYYLKLRAVKRLLGLERFHTLVSKIEGHERSIRALYVEGHDRLANITGRALTNLLALDAVTIIAAMLKYLPSLRRTLNIGTGTQFPASVCDAIETDAMLLENQIPLVVLQYAMESMDVEDVHIQLQNLVCILAQGVSPFRNRRTRWTLSSPIDENRSPLSCSYDLLIAPLPVPQSSQNQGVTRSKSSSICGYMRTLSRAVSGCCGSTSLIAPSETIPTASRLRTSGINFRACDHGSFTGGITFDKHNVTLSLPRIQVNDDTERCLLNFLAYEGTCTSSNYYLIASYVQIMDCLLNDEEDVKLLVDCGVIENVTGSDREVAIMWNKLTKNLSYDITPAHQRVVMEVNEMRRIGWRKAMAGFKETYFEKKPWLLVSLVAAALLFALTFLQTFYTVKAFYH